MIIYPAIDIKQGKCVRLVQGRFSDVTVYSDNPVEMAIKWESMGAEYIHVVDLDGALQGQSVNSQVIKDIAKAVKVPIQLGGGIRNLQVVEDMLNSGITRVILGTAAVKNPDFVKEAVELYKDRIAVGIDAKDGMVAIEGWETISEFTAVQFAQKMYELGVRHIIYTDISRDGMLKGPNIPAMKEMVDNVEANIIASGGVSNMDDIRNLKATGVQGVIIGKALYTGNVNLAEALKIAGE